MENIIIKGNKLEEILENNSSEFKVVIYDYKFIGVDHDLWEFETILQRFSDNKFFSVNRFDNYSCNWHELGLDEEDFELTEVIPREVMTTIYE